MKKMFQSVIAAIVQCTSQEGRIFRYSLSYCLLLVLFPSLVVIVIMFQNGLINIDIVLNLIYQFVPQAFIEPFVNFVLSRDYSTGVSGIIALLVSGYMSSNIFYSFMLISAKSEEFKTYGFLIRIKSTVFFALFLAIIIAVTFLINYGPLGGKFLSIVAAFFILYVFYRTLTFAKRSYWYGVPGALCCSIAIIVVGALFFDFIKVFTSYENIYGPLTSVAISLLAIYVISTIIYFGYCLNNVYDCDCKITEYKNVWFYNKGNKIIKYLEEKLNLKKFM